MFQRTPSERGVSQPAVRFGPAAQFPVGQGTIPRWGSKELDGTYLNQGESPLYWMNNLLLGSPWPLVASTCFAQPCSRTPNCGRHRTHRSLWLKYACYLRVVAESIYRNQPSLCQLVPLCHQESQHQSHKPSTKQPSNQPTNQATHPPPSLGGIVLGPLGLDERLQLLRQSHPGPAVAGDVDPGQPPLARILRGLLEQDVLRS